MFEFEQGPIRPPSEARSLLIRATRNCPWNRCEFCHTYKGRKFQIRPVPEIKKDIERAREIADEIREISWRHGCGGEITDEVVRIVYGDYSRYGESHRSVAAWLYFGGSQAFIQDANSLIMKTEDLADVLAFLKQEFPSITRITTYARSKTLASKTVEELTALRKAGLSRIHVGLETGHDPLLAYIRKGVTAAEHVEAGRKVVESGISLCEYVMPGLGGKRWSTEHAVATATTLNRINPQFIRLRTLCVSSDMPLYRKVESGEMELLEEDDVVREIRLFVERLEGIRSCLVSDHILNLLEEVEGRLPEDKEKMIALIDRYLSLPARDRLAFKVGRRAGLYRRLDDLRDSERRLRVEEIIGRLDQRGEGKAEESLRALMNRFI
ncbi:MAG: radical SAM protein [Deltaproteobacteria bacterium]|nr:radical SAM protein [Deltaproteobacteria bacterium]